MNKITHLLRRKHAKKREFTNFYFPHRWYRYAVLALPEHLPASIYFCRFLFTIPSYRFHFFIFWYLTQYLIVLINSQNEWPAKLYKFLVCFRHRVILYRWLTECLCLSFSRNDLSFKFPACTVCLRDTVLIK